MAKCLIHCLVNHRQWIWNLRSLKVKIGLEMFALVNIATILEPKWNFLAELAAFITAAHVLIC